MEADDDDDELLMGYVDIESPPPMHPCPAEDDEDIGLVAFVEMGEKVEPTFDKGCLDPEVSTTCSTCSPCFAICKGSDDVFVLHNHIPPQQYQSSPTKLIVGDSTSAEFLAKCTRRMQAVDSTTLTTGCTEYSTTFALAPTLVGCARHATPREPPASRNASCSVVDASPACSSCYNRKDIARADLHWGSELPDTKIWMRDPISNVLWTARETGECCTMDFEVLPINNARVAGQRRIHENAHIMLPASVTYFGDTVTSLACGVVGFPMVDETLNKFNSNDEADRLCSKYRYTVRRELNDRMKSMYGGSLKNMDSETKSTLKQHTKEQLRVIVKDMLVDCFGRLRTGDLVCSVGKVLACSETMLAANYSTLPGSSGSAVFSPLFPAGTFIGVQAGAASSLVSEKGTMYPDYNVATSTDNPAFFVSYFNDVIPRLPPPSTFQAEERSDAFRHYLLKHLKLIHSQNLAVSAEHQRWLQWAVQGDPPEPIRRKLFVDAVHKVLPHVGLMLLRVSDQLLKFSLSCRKKGFHFPATTEELETTLTDEVRRTMFFTGVEQEMKSHGVDIEAWGLPVRVHCVPMLLKLASELEDQ